MNIPFVPPLHQQGYQPHASQNQEKNQHNKGRAGRGQGSLRMAEGRARTASRETNGKARNSPWGFVLWRRGQKAIRRLGCGQA